MPGEPKTRRGVPKIYFLACFLGTTVKQGVDLLKRSVARVKTSQNPDATDHEDEQFSNVTCAPPAALTWASAEIQETLRRRRVRKPRLAVKYAKVLAFALSAKKYSKSKRVPHVPKYAVPDSPQDMLDGVGRDAKVANKGRRCSGKCKFHKPSHRPQAITSKMPP